MAATGTRMFLSSRRTLVLASSGQLSGFDLFSGLLRRKPLRRFFLRPSMGFFCLSRETLPLQAFEPCLGSSLLDARLDDAKVAAHTDDEEEKNDTPDDARM